jgi:hypothetical protein
LTVLLMESKKCTDAEVDYYMSGIFSWNLCEHFARTI